MAKEYIGYHGTSPQNAQSILKNKEFKISNKENEWLGPGVYFFEDDIYQAINFCRKARKMKEFIVLKSLLKGNIIIDLVNTENYRWFMKIHEKIKNKNKYKNKKLLNSIVLNIMYQLKPYDIVRCIFEVPKTDYLYKTNIRPYQIQLCVRNKKCIKNIEEVECNGI